jgi:hypothetical protein
VHLDIIEVFYSPTGAQVNCLKNNFKIYIKIDIKTAPTYFVEVIIRALGSTSNALPDDGVTSTKHVGAVLMSILI